MGVAVVVTELGATAETVLAPPPMSPPGAPVGASRRAIPQPRRGDRGRAPLAPVERCGAGGSARRHARSFMTEAMQGRPWPFMTASAPARAAPQLSRNDAARSRVDLCSGIRPNSPLAVAGAAGAAYVYPSATNKES